jgi:hypothetical protein
VTFPGADGWYVPPGPIERQQLGAARDIGDPATPLGWAIGLYILEVPMSGALDLEKASRGALNIPYLVMSGTNDAEGGRGWQAATKFAEAALSLFVVESATRGIVKSFSSVIVPEAEFSSPAIDPKRLDHIFGQSKHELDGFVQANGGQEQAFTRIQDAANAALREGRLTVGPNGVLPTGNAGNIINVGGTQVRLIGGWIVDGTVRISSVSRRGLP